MTGINPIETVYKGYRFRSRLEARWAVFFDAMGMPYQYEKEGYDLKEAGWYLPDFWLPEQNCFIEIRPAVKFVYDTKCAALSYLSNETVLYIAGEPYFKEYRIAIYEPDMARAMPNSNPYQFAVCRRCAGIWIYDDKGTCQNLNCSSDCNSDRYPLLKDNRLLAAYTKARQARFEHGAINE